jgi:hypothetical protein
MLFPLQSSALVRVDLLPEELPDTLPVTMVTVCALVGVNRAQLVRLPYDSVQDFLCRMR